jgi:hypothetical protein
LLVDVLVPAGGEKDPVFIGPAYHHHARARLIAVHRGQAKAGVLRYEFEDFFFGHDRAPLGYEG